MNDGSARWGMVATLYKACGGPQAIGYICCTPNIDCAQEQPSSSEATSLLTAQQSWNILHFGVYLPIANTLQRQETLYLIKD